MARIGNWQAADSVRDRVAFDTFTGSLRGHRGRVGSLGRLPERWRAELERRDDVAYTVMSYGTPIAWEYSDGEVVMPAVDYSSTTGRHQSIVRGAMMGGGAHVPWGVERWRAGDVYAATAMPARRRTGRHVVATGVAAGETWDAERARPALTRWQWHVDTTGAAAGECVYTLDGHDTDGTPWHRCLVHDELAISSDFQCAGHPPAAPYAERGES